MRCFSIALLQSVQTGTVRVERKLTRWWNSCESTMEIFQTRLIDDFGGFLEVYADQPHMV